MRSQVFFAALTVVTTAACRTTRIEGGGGSTSSQTSVSASSSAATSVTTGGGGTCDMIGKCQGDSMTPASGCLECAIIGNAGTATDGGTCLSQYLAVYGMDGMCAGGQPAVCTYESCVKSCDPMLMFSTQAAWDCLCTNDKMGASSKCLPAAMETNKSTCVGALLADQAAAQALVNFQTCIVSTVCPKSCPAPGG